jgi:hypothetical protein
MRSKLATLCREPLVHFLLIGAGLFTFWYAVGDRVTPPPNRIVISPAHVERLAQVFARTRLRPPRADELAGLVEQEIEEEVLYREALAMGLDRDDIIIRRQLCLKMDFLADDLSAVESPTDEQLQAFLQQHAGKFASEPLTTFAQVFVNRTQRGEAAASAAQRLLDLLNGQAPPDWHKLGDPLPLPQEYEAASEVEIARQLGREFPKKLSGLPVGRWTGPVESAYGLHLVRIRERTAARAPVLAAVHDAAVREWRAARRQELKEDLRRRLRAKYTVTVEWPDWAREAAGVTSGVGPPKGQGGPS